MDQRMAFIVAWQAGEASVAALSRHFGIGRKTGYKWLGHFQADGLADRSRTPLTSPRARAPEREAKLLALRHPKAGS